MESYLPKVNQDICWSIEKEITDDEYVNNIAKHIATNNPTIAGFLHEFLGRLPDMCCKKSAMMASFITYRFLESQMQADKMKNEIKL